jgi:membrane protein implicated in regulation of membrane protease activity
MVKKTGIGWPVVALVAVLAAAFIGIFALIPDDEPESRTMLLTAITTASSAIVMWFVKRKTDEVSEKVDRVEELVNGNTARLIGKISDPVSRADEARRHEERSG